jgi:hypothetical protein
MNPLLPQTTNINSTLIERLKIKRICHYDPWYPGQISPFDLYLVNAFYPGVINRILDLSGSKYSNNIGCHSLSERPASIKMLISESEQIRQSGTRQTEPQREWSEITGITSKPDETTIPEGEKESGNHQAGIQHANKQKLENIVFQG